MGWKGMAKRKRDPRFDEASISPEALDYYFQQSTRDVGSGERMAAQRKARSASAATWLWVGVTLASLAASLLLFVDSQQWDYFDLLHTTCWMVAFLLFLAVPFWFYLALRSKRIARAAKVIRDAGEVCVYDLWPEWAALAQAESPKRMAADGALLQLTGRDVELHPNLMPRRLELVAGILYRLDGHGCRDFAWLNGKSPVEEPPFA